MRFLGFSGFAKNDDEDLRDEIRAHLTIAADARKADGVDSREAELAALKDFGNVTLTREAARRVWVPSWLRRDARSVE